MIRTKTSVIKAPPCTGSDERRSSESSTRRRCPKL
jgi:hypothetical protein